MPNEESGLLPTGVLSSDDLCALEGACSEHGLQAAEASPPPELDFNSMLMQLMWPGPAGPDGPYSTTEDDSLVANLMKLLIVDNVPPNCG